jgi:hypothetical protein
MTQRSNDEIADALRGLTSGEPAPPAPAAGSAGAGRQRAAAPLTPGVSRPAAPAGAPHPGTPDLTTGIQPIDEDDAVVVPAAPLSALGPHARPAVRRHSRSAASAQKFRQTIIPILVTLGALMFVTAALKYVVHPDAPLAALPGWVALVLVGGGVVLMLLAVINMIQGTRQDGPRR